MSDVTAHCPYEGFAGDALVKVGRASEAEELVLTTLPEAAREGSLGYQAELTLRLAFIRLQRKQTDQALDAMSRAAAFARAAGGNQILAGIAFERTRSPASRESVARRGECPSRWHRCISLYGRAHFASAASVATRRGAVVDKRWFHYFLRRNARLPDRSAETTENLELTLSRSGASCCVVRLSTAVSARVSCDAPRGASSHRVSGVSDSSRSLLTESTIRSIASTRLSGGRAAPKPTPLSHCLGVTRSWENDDSGYVIPHNLVSL